MLDAIGVGSLEDLFAEIPAGVRLQRPLDLPDGMSEGEVFDHLSALAARNRHADAEVTFLGAGMYDHYVPSMIDSILARSEFLTPVHALPARDLAGRAAGDVRVPDGHLGADRAAGVQRLGLRGPVGGRRRGLPGQAGDQAEQARGLARPASALARGAAHPRRRLRDERGGGRAQRPRAPPTSTRSRRWSTTTPPRCSCSSPTSSARSRSSAPSARPPSAPAPSTWWRPTRCRWASSSRRARWAPTCAWARARRWATGSTSAARRSGSSPPTSASSARCPAGSPARRATWTASAASCSPSRRASSTSAARRPRTTSAPRRRSTRWPAWSTSPGSASAGWWSSAS